MKKTFFILFCLITLVYENIGSQAAIRTIILLRHAEKLNDGSRDPELSSIGMDRAQRFADMFSYQKFDKLYSTDYKRTRNTLTPLAKNQKLSITVYSAEANGDYFDKIIESEHLQSLVICGHSNTIPKLVNHWIPQAQLSDLQENEYDKVFIIQRISPNFASLMILKL